MPQKDQEPNVSEGEEEFASDQEDEYEEEGWEPNDMDEKLETVQQRWDFPEKEQELAQIRAQLQKTKSLCSRAATKTILESDLKKTFSDLTEAIQSTASRSFSHYDTEVEEISMTDQSAQFQALEATRNEEIAAIQRDLEAQRALYTDEDLSALQSAVADLQLELSRYNELLETKQTYHSHIFDDFESIKAAYQTDVEERIAERQEAVNRKKKDIKDRALVYFSEESDRLIEAATTHRDQTLEEAKVETRSLCDASVEDSNATIVQIIETARSEMEGLQMSLEQENSKICQHLEERRGHMEDEIEEHLTEVLDFLGSELKKKADQLSALKTKIALEEEKRRFFEEWGTLLARIRTNQLHHRSLETDSLELLRLYNEVGKRIIQIEGERISESLYLERYIKQSREYTQFVQQSQNRVMAQQRMHNQEFNAMQNSLLNKIQKYQEDRRKMHKDYESEVQKLTTKASEACQVKKSEAIQLVQEKIRRCMSELDDLKGQKQLILNQRPIIETQMRTAQDRYDMYSPDYDREREKRRTISNQISEMKHIIRNVCVFSMPARRSHHSMDYPLVDISVEGQIQLFDRETVTLSYAEADKVYSGDTDYGVIAGDLLNYFKLFMDGYDMTLIRYGNNSLEDVLVSSHDGGSVLKELIHLFMGIQRDDVTYTFWAFIVEVCNEEYTDMIECVEKNCRQAASDYPEMKLKRVGKFSEMVLMLNRVHAKQRENPNYRTETHTMYILYVSGENTKTKEIFQSYFHFFNLAGSQVFSKDILTPSEENAKSDLEAFGSLINQKKIKRRSVLTQLIEMALKSTHTAVVLSQLSSENEDVQETAECLRLLRTLPTFELHPPGRNLQQRARFT